MKTSGASGVVRAAFVAGAVVWTWACSGSSAPAPSVAPEPSLAPPSTAPPPTSEAPPASEAPTTIVAIDSGLLPTPLSTSTDAAHVRGRYVADLEVVDVDLEVARAVHVQHPNATIRSRLDTLTDRAVVQYAGQVQYEAGDREHDFPQCRALAATRQLVSIVCSSSWAVDDRDGGWAWLVTSYAFEIAGEEVRPVDLASAFVPDASFSDVEFGALRDACATQDPNAYGTDDCTEGWHVVARSLSRDGVYMAWRSDWGDQLIEGEIPYASVIDRIRADGPVARMLRLGAFAHGATAATDAPAAATDAGPWVIGARMPDVEAATRWAALPMRLQGAVSMFAQGDLVQLGVTSDVGIDAAREVATALHGTLAAAPAGFRLERLALRQANTSVNVREDATGQARWLGTIPRGAVVVVIEPSVPDTWTWVTASPGVDGWSAARYLEATDCIPDATSAVAAMPAEARPGATRTATRIVASVLESGRPVPAVLLLAHDDAHTYASLRRLSTATCRVGDELSSWVVEGVVVDALVTRTTRGTDGETLVLLQIDGRTDASVRWIALRRGTAEPVWTRAGLAHPADANELHAPALRGPSGRGFWPAAVVRRGAPIVPLRWDGTTLVEDVP